MTVSIRSSVLLGVLALVLWSCALAAGDQPAELSNFFHEYIGLNEDQIGAIRNGRAVAKVSGFQDSGRGIRLRVRVCGLVAGALSAICLGS